jgi:hypothetical protein
MHCSKFGFLGNDFHFPSREIRAARAAERAVAGAVAVCKGLFIAPTMRDAISGSNHKIPNRWNPFNWLIFRLLRS